MPFDVKRRLFSLEPSEKLFINILLLHWIWKRWWFCTV